MDVLRHPIQRHLRMGVRILTLGNTDVLHPATFIPPFRLDVVVSSAVILENTS